MTRLERLPVIAGSPIVGSNLIDKPALELDALMQLNAFHSNPNPKFTGRTPDPKG